MSINGMRGNAVELWEANWRASRETLHLVSNRGMGESILKVMMTASLELNSEPLWRAGSPLLLRRSKKKPKLCWISWPLIPISSHYLLWWGEA
jgi:hypothetical protein